MQKKYVGGLSKKSMGCSPLSYHLLAGKCSSVILFVHGAQMCCVSTLQNIANMVIR